MKYINEIVYGKMQFVITFIFILFYSSTLNSQWITEGNVSGLGSWPSIFVLDQNTIFVAGGDTGPNIWRSTDAGASFTQLPTNGLPLAGSNRFISCIWATNINTIFVGDGITTGNGLVKNAKVYRTTNGGNNWTMILNSGTNVYGFLNGIVFSRTNPLLGVANCDPNSTTENFKNWKTTDGGTTWTLYEPSAPNSSGAQNSVFLVDNNFFGFGLNTANARVAITTNGGTTFNFYTLAGAGGANGFVSSVAFNDDKINGIAGTDQTSTTVSRTTNGGLNWFAQNIPCTITGQCCVKWVPGTSVVYIIVSNSSASQCFKSYNNGNDWTQYSFPSGAVNIKHSHLFYSVDKDPDTELYYFATNNAGNIYLLHEIPMPVKLFSFTYFISGRDNILKWVTSEELNNAGFEVYRATENLNSESSWQKLGYVKGNGTKNTPSYYEFTDKNLNAGKYYYRIKQIDYNGNYEYFNLSGIVEISNPVKYSLAQNYPNPFNPETNIKFQITDNSFVEIKVFDILGKEIATLVNEYKPAGYYEAKFSGANLSSGIYFYKLKINGHTFVRSMLLAK